MLVIIGNSPSSGSTLLADLLDSVNYAACGIELNLFSNKKLYQFEKFKKNINVSSKSSSIYSRRISLNKHRLYSYGLNVDEFSAMVERCESVQEFVTVFSQHFFALRGKSPRSIFFDKTPQNINCIGEFLQAFPKSYFIHIVRNPMYVYASLLRRGFPKYIALITWLIDVAKYYQYRDNERVLLVKYEELTSAPYLTIKELLKRITGEDISEMELKENYANNRYRQLHSKKITSWSVKEFGQVKDANNKILPENIVNDFSQVKNLTINPRYAELFDLYPLNYVDAMEFFDYKLPLGVPEAAVSKSPRKKLIDTLYMMNNFTRDFLHGDASVGSVFAYLEPVKTIN